MNDLIMSPVFMLFLGVLAHFAKALSQAKLSGIEMTVWQYWRGNVPQSVLTLIGAIVGYVALQETGNLTLVNAFGIGFMANSVADVIGGRVRSAL